MAKLRFTVEDLLSCCSILKDNHKFSPEFDRMTAEAAEYGLRSTGTDFAAS